MQCTVSIDACEIEMWAVLIHAGGFLGSDSSHRGKCWMSGVLGFDHLRELFNLLPKRHVLAIAFDLIT